MMAQGREPSAEAKQAHRNAAYTARLKPKTNAANTKILAFDRPIIAAVNGAAVGWGMDLACLCDIIIASDQARFASLFVKRGLCPDLGGLNRLPQIVGPQVAAELLFTGCGTWQRGGNAFFGVISESVSENPMHRLPRQARNKTSGNTEENTAFLQAHDRRIHGSGLRPRLSCRSG